MQRLAVDPEWRSAASTGVDINQVSITGVTSGITWICHAHSYVVFWFDCYYRGQDHKDMGLRMQACVRAEPSDLAVIISHIHDHKWGCKIHGYLEYHRSGKAHLVCEDLTLYLEKTYSPHHPPILKWSSNAMLTLP